MSETTDAYLAELEAAEAQAAGLLEEAGPDGEGLNRRASVTISRMREALKRHGREVDRIREEALTQARAELVAERKAEASYRRLGVPDGPARALFEGVDAADDAAMAARASELRDLGISWNGQPLVQAAPQGPDLAATVAQQQAMAAGGGSPEPWDVKMRRMGKDPGAFSDQERDQVVGEFNKAVRSAALPHSSGAVG